MQSEHALRLPRTCGNHTAPLHLQSALPAPTSDLRGRANRVRRYDSHGMRQLRLPTLDYCSPTTQQVRNDACGVLAFGACGQRRWRARLVTDGADEPRPTLHARAQLEAGLDFIRRQPPGASVYVHCKAGRGRAGTMLMAYLMDGRGLTPSEAQVRAHVIPLAQGGVGGTPWVA